MTPPAEASAQPAPPRVSVVIVSFNRVETLRKSLTMLGDAHRIIVVDNGSVDGSASLDDEFPHARFSRLPKDFGLTKALNIGLRSAEGEFILFLHDDTLITDDAVTKLADFLETHQDTGAVCPFLTDESGNPAPQCSPLPTPSNPDPGIGLPGSGEEVAVECVSGAAIMFRAFIFNALRPIDERYGMYGSNLEICTQMRRAGKKVVILRAVTAVHQGLDSPMPKGALQGDRAAGTAAFLEKHHGFAAGLGYRVKRALTALITLRISVLAGAVSGQKIDGTR
ncbi:MAG TPA: glycosyltransferase [Bryobacteraceae bacterium]|nr:glycosyltransferase [Bryobacteraceae bacterium]